MATNNTPLDATLTIYPLDTEGNRISNVSLTSTDLKAGSTDQEVTFTTTGTISNFDGVEIVARIKAVDSQTLSPNQTLLLKNIRVKVNGYYQKEL